ncbi:MAG: CBS domain-containing protein [Candidatus Heimdallarchaeaceae archaeon]
MTSMINILKEFFGIRKKKKSTRKPKKRKVLRKKKEKKKKSVKKIKKIKPIKKLKKIKSIKELPKKEKILKKISEKSKVQKKAIIIETIVKDIMTTDVKYVSQEDDLRKTLELLSDYNISGVPVLSNNRLVGIITETDIMKILGLKNILDLRKDQIELDKLEKIKVKSVMNKKPITITPNMNITDVISILNKFNINTLIVVDERKKMIGIATREDIMKGISNEFFVKSLEKTGMIIESKIDQLINIIRERESETIPKLSKELGIKTDIIEDWAKILEEHDLIKIEYPFIGPPKLKMKE